MKDLITLRDWSVDQIEQVISLAADIKSNPVDYKNAMEQRTLLMIFEKPSLRTRLSFEAGMTQMGGHAIYYHTETSPMGSGKESISDSMKTASRYVDIIMARLFNHDHLIEMASQATVPVINALTNDSHPCQILADLLSIKEKKGELKGLKIAYVGDGYNNVTHSLMTGVTKLGLNIAVASPSGDQYMPSKEITDLCYSFAEASGGSIMITNSVEDAVKNADVIYTDSWMSYHIPAEQKSDRIKLFMPYQVNKSLLKLAKPDAIFMNCLPATRGCEQTAEVIDGPQSIVFDQAENRLHAQKAVMLSLLSTT